MKIIIEEDNAPDTYVKESSIEGYGLFASKDFKRGELIIDYNLFPENWYQMKYVDLYVDFLLNKSIYQQFKAFYFGFHSVCASNAVIVTKF